MRPNIPTMPLCQALNILAKVHTDDDDQVGFIVQVGAGPHYTRNIWVTEEQYIAAWESVRHAAGLQVEPLKSAER